MLKYLTVIQKIPGWSGYLSLREFVIYTLHILHILCTEFCAFQSLIHLFSMTERILCFTYKTSDVEFLSLK